jgi:spoIIIJ-associated protein
MERFEAKSLEDTYKLASNKFECSITNLDITILQFPSIGFFGFGKKNAIIECKRVINNISNNSIDKAVYNKKSILNIKDISSKISSLNNSSIVNNININIDIVEDIKSKIDELFSNIDFSLDDIEVSLDNNDKSSIYIKFLGDDVALLIGKEAKRYNALSYILFNWISEKYKLKVKVEVGEFLQNQENSIDRYIEFIINSINKKGYIKTKPINRLFITKVLDILRSEFPNKYIVVRTNDIGLKYILVAPYRESK